MPSRPTRPPSLQTQPPHGFRMWNAFAAVPFEPDAGFRHGLLLFFRLWLVVHRCVAQSTGYGIDNRFQKSDQSRKLRLRQSVNQLVSMLAVAHREPPESVLSHSAMVKPNSASTSSCGIGWLCLSQSSASATALRSALLKVSRSSSETMVSSR